MLLIIGVCALASGCQNPVTTWSAEARSPDGSSLASASTLQFSGPGNAGLYTSVYLKRTVFSNPPEEILLFDENNVSQSEAATLNLGMKWETPSHLSVTYNGHAATLDFQVVKCEGVDISMRDLSSEAAGGNDSK